MLRQRAPEVTEIDGTLVGLVDGMVEAMHASRGLAVAAPQVGVEKRLFVYDLGEGEGTKTVINPTLIKVGGEWTYDEGCLSVPGLYFTIVRPRDVVLTGWDLDGNELSIEASRLEGRMFQHEFDHLEGTLLLEYLQPAQRKAALRLVRERQVGGRMVKGETVTIDPDGRITDDTD